MVWMAVGLVVAVLITGGDAMNPVSSPLPQGAAAAYQTLPVSPPLASPNTASAPYTNYLQMVASPSVMSRVPNTIPRQSYFPNTPFVIDQSSSIPGTMGLRQAPIGAAQARRRGSRAMRFLNFIGKIRAARDLECKTTPDHLGLDVPRYIPMKCDRMCLPPNMCRMVGNMGFCCPFFVTDQLIARMGTVEASKLLF